MTFCLLHRQNLEEGGGALPRDASSVCLQDEALTVAVATTLVTCKHASPKKQVPSDLPSLLFSFLMHIAKPTNPNTFTSYTISIPLA
jgi:hypothetical protein